MQVEKQKLAFLGLWEYLSNLSLAKAMGLSRVLHCEAN